MDEKILKQLRPGATVRVYERIREGNKEREGIFQGIVLGRKHGNEAGATFIVHSTIGGVGVEKVYPVHAPTLSRIEILSSPKKVRRAKLYYLRQLSKKRVRQKMGV